MPRFQTVLFDLDGTLIDSVDLIVDSYRHVFATHGLPEHSRDEILVGIGTPLRSVFGALTDDPAEIDRWIATYREFNLAHHDQRVTAYPSTVDMVRRIRGAGCRVGLVTSKNHAGALRGLDLIGLRDAIEVVVGADDVTRPKPDPEPARLALEALGVPADGALFVGDSRHDMYCGRSAGTWTAGVTWGPFDRDHLAAAAPDYIVDTPAALLTLVTAPAPA